MYQVLIVEDDPMVASIHRNYIERYGKLHIAAHCSNGHDALSIIEKQPIDLAIVDVYMPLMDGASFVAELRKRALSTDIIMVTAANDAQHIRQFLTLGVLDYLVKPFEFSRFAQAIDRFMHKQSLFSASSISQQALDAYFRSSADRNAGHPLLRKGLQEQTLSFILEYMRAHAQESRTCEQIAAALNLSRVTIRRYMNYLIEQGDVFSQIDYTTGGRPSMLYRFSAHS